MSLWRACRLQRRQVSARRLLLRRACTARCAACVAVGHMQRTPTQVFDYTPCSVASCDARAAPTRRDVPSNVQPAFHCTAPCGRRYALAATPPHLSAACARIAGGRAGSQCPPAPWCHFLLAARAPCGRHQRTAPLQLVAPLGALCPECSPTGLWAPPPRLAAHSGSAFLRIVCERARACICKCLYAIAPI